MLIESGTDAQFKHSLLCGWDDTVRVTLEHMDGRWLHVDNWGWFHSRHFDTTGLVVANMTSSLDQIGTRLYLESCILRHGLAFELEARVTCSFFNRPDRRIWMFEKAPARTGSAKQSVSAVPARSSVSQLVDISDH